MKPRTSFAPEKQNYSMIRSTLAQNVYVTDTDQSPPLLIRVTPTAGGALFCLQNVAFQIVE
jgi:hypothetical protein